MAMWKWIPFQGVRTPAPKKERTGEFYQRTFPTATVLTGQAAINDHADRKKRFHDKHAARHAAREI